MFEVTIEIMKWYENFFGFPFPFSKYDHVFCPEFNVGAMENAGVITVNDQYIFKDKVKLESISFRAIIVAHELAHSNDFSIKSLLNILNLKYSVVRRLGHYGMVEWPMVSFIMFW